mgnify:CR=1 FL=1
MRKRLLSYAYDLVQKERDTLSKNTMIQGKLGHFRFWNPIIASIEFFLSNVWLCYSMGFKKDVNWTDAKMIQNNIQTFFLQVRKESALALKDQNFTFSKSILKKNYEWFLKDFSFSFLSFLSQLCSSIFLEVRSKIARCLISEYFFLCFSKKKESNLFAFLLLSSKVLELESPFKA